MSEPVSEGCGEKPPRRSLLPLLAAAVVFFTLSAVVMNWSFRALLKKPLPPVPLAAAPDADPASAAPAATPQPAAPQLDLQALAARRRSELMNQARAANAVGPNDQLQPARTVAGRVLNADGRPAVDAQVYLASGSEQLSISDGHVLHRIPAPVDTNGNFQFPPQSQNFLILAYNDDGCAQVDQDQFAKNTDLTLSPWGRIEGRAMIGTVPARRNTIAAFTVMSVGGRLDGVPAIHQFASLKADEAGNFAIPRLVPGFVMIGRFLQNTGQNNGMLYFAINIDTSVTSGTTTKVTIGGSGRPVTGRVVLSDSARRLHGLFSMANAMSTMWSIPDPPDAQGMTSGDRFKWQDDWRRSEPGKALNAAELQGRVHGTSYGFAVSQDGRFRIDDVVPGDYRLSFSFVPDSRPDVHTPSINAYAQFTMPPIDGGRSDVPLELPDIQMR